MVASSVRVVLSFPSRSPAAPDILDSVEWALQRAAYRAGAHSIELVVHDTSDPVGSYRSEALEKVSAEKAAADPQVMLYLGPISSSQAEIGIPITSRAGIAQICFSATWPGLTKPGYGPGEPQIYYPSGVRNFFRVVPTDDVQAAGAARWAKSLGLERVLIVDAGSLYGKGLAQIFQASAKDAGLELAGHESFDETTVSDEGLAELAGRLSAAGADMIYAAGNLEPALGKLITALRKTGDTTPLMGGEVFANWSNHLSPETAEGMYYTSLMLTVEQLQDAEDFVESFRQSHDHDPHAFAIGAYESVELALHTIAKTERVDRASVLDTLRSMKSYQGILGSWHFDENGDTSLQSVSGYQITESRSRFVGIIR